MPEITILQRAGKMLFLANDRIYKGNLSLAGSSVTQTHRDIIFDFNIIHYVN